MMIYALRVSKYIPTRKGIKKEYESATVIGSYDDVELYLQKNKVTLEGLDWFEYNEATGDLL